MKRNLYKLIKEQFSISDIDFSDIGQEYASDIFNKNTEIYGIYAKIINNQKISRSEIKKLNNIVSEIAPNDINELLIIVRYYSLLYPYESLNWLDVSGITDMNNLFNESDYNGDISKWDTSNVTDMHSMFLLAEKFNQPIGDWDVSHVTDMSEMFCCTVFNQDISNWDVSNVTNMEFMFEESEFNSDISKWDVSNVTNMNNMFLYSPFNQDISNWNISNVKKYFRVFAQCPIKRAYKPKKK